MQFFTDKTDVFFTCIEKTFHVSSVFCEINLPFLSAPLTIRWYGVIIAFGFTLAVLFGGRTAYVWKIDINKMIDILIYGAFAGIIGARAYYVLSEWSYYGKNPGEIFKIWHGGLAIYGGLIGGLIAAFIVCIVEKINIPNLLDLCGMSFLIGQGIGRWGNFANQEAFGSITYRHWGMMSDTVADYIARNPQTFGLEGVENIPQYLSDNDLYVHPTFFYESVWCLVGFGLLYLILRKFRTFSGELFLCYGVWYGLGRMVIEGLRTDSLFVGNTSIRVSQVLSGALCLLCFVLLLVFKVHFKRHPKPIEGIDYFPEKTEKEKRAEQRRAEQKAMRQKAKQVKIRDGKIVRPDAKTQTSEPLPESAPAETAQEEPHDAD